ncbi:MAG TPA: hypothetical protein VN214_03450 [Pseudomonas sp.]|nr:hypothetical protein [Pseudomonas sp.]
MTHVNTAPATTPQITDANLSLEAKMTQSTYVENLKSEHSKLLLEVEKEEQKLSDLEREKDEMQAQVENSLGPNGRRTNASLPLQRAHSDLTFKYDSCKSKLGAARARLRELDRSLTAESQVQKHRDELLNAQSQLVVAEANKRRVDTVCNELRAELTKEEESLQKALEQHADQQLEARLAGDSGSSLPKAVADLHASINGKRATLTAAESRKQSCADEIDSLQQKIRQEKANWETARLALAELRQCVALEGIMPVIAAHLAAMRESGHSYSKTSITVTVGVDEIEAARIELRKELLSEA